MYKADREKTDKTFSIDSLKYYKKVLRQPDSLWDNRDLTAGNLVTLNADQAKFLFFAGDLSVAFRRKRKMDREVQKSTIHLITPAPVEIEVNGYYNSPLELLVLGYWSWSQRCADLLPLDYWPDNKLAFPDP